MMPCRDSSRCSGAEYARFSRCVHIHIACRRAVLPQGDGPEVGRCQQEVPRGLRAGQGPLRQGRVSGSAVDTAAAAVLMHTALENSA